MGGGLPPVRLQNSTKAHNDSPRKDRRGIFRYRVNRFRKPSNGAPASGSKLPVRYLTTTLRILPILMKLPCEKRHSAAYSTGCEMNRRSSASTYADAALVVVWRQLIAVAATGSVFLGYAPCRFRNTIAAMA
jgi:hypothetical protein